VTRWVTFDCFGTLVDWHTGFARVVQPIAGERTAELLSAYHRAERRLERDVPHRRYRNVLVDALLAAAAETGVAMSEAESARLPETWGSQPVFPDVEPMLAALRQTGCSIGILTNCDIDLFAGTERAFQQPFDLVVTAETVKDYKPAPAHFRYFERATGVERRAWVHVACSWYHDIQPARDLGIRRVWLDRDRTGEDPASASAYVRSARDVPDAVIRLLG
jgi:2-haloacid dehalogenase